MLGLVHRYSALALVCSVAGLLPLSALAGPVQVAVPTDSFIVQHVGTVGQLYQQISLDPVVRRRLARHFHTSAPAVTRYIQDNLVLTTLKTAHRYRVYCVGRNGQEYVINSRLAAGTPVFVLRSTGQPVLKLACGNPMVAALPVVKGKIASTHPPTLVSAAAPVPMTPASLLTSSGPVVVAMPGTPGVVVMPTTKVAGFISQLPVVHSGGGFPLGYLAGIPILATVLGNHGGSSSTPNAGTTGTNTAGTNTSGTNTTGTSTSGTNTSGTSTNGNNTSGTNTSGTSTSGTNTSGTNTSGTNTSGTNTSGTNTNGNNTSGTSTNGNNTSGTSTSGTNNGNTGVTAVPEPSTPAAFAIGGAALLYLLGSAKRRRRSELN